MCDHYWGIILLCLNNFGIHFFVYFTWILSIKNCVIKQVLLFRNWIKFEKNTNIYLAITLKQERIDCTNNYQQMVSKKSFLLITLIALFFLSDNLKNVEPRINI